MVNSSIGILLGLSFISMNTYFKEHFSKAEVFLKMAVPKSQTFKE